jgi:FkbM family methyltransferase
VNQRLSARKKIMSSLYITAATAAHRLLNTFGLEMTRLRNTPKYSLLGLAALPVKTVIDIGANRGFFARDLMKLFPEARFYCFEPLPQVFAELKLWADSLPAGKVQAWNVALGNASGSLNMFAHSEHDPSSSLLPSTSVSDQLYPFTKAQHSVEVELTTLDKVMSQVSAVESDVLIKLDVQGYEKQVILGGQQTLATARACIIEINLMELYRGQPSFSELVALFHNLGYRYAGNLDQVYDHSGKVVYIDALFLRE